MSGPTRWVQGGLAALVGVIALTAAGAVKDGRFVTGGLLIFFAGLTYIGYLVKDYWDERDAHADRR